MMAKDGTGGPYGPPPPQSLAGITDEGLLVVVVQVSRKGVGLGLVLGLCRAGQQGQEQVGGRWSLPLD